MQDLLKDYPSLLDLPVMWGEMDAAQHVNNVVYLRYSEAGRIAYFRDFGFSVSVMDEKNQIGPILAEINCKYKVPLTFPDTITVATRIKADSIEDYSFEVEQIIVSHRHQRIAAQITSRLVAYDYINLKKALLPEELKNRLRGFEK